MPGGAPKEFSVELRREAEIRDGASEELLEELSKNGWTLNEFPNQLWRNFRRNSGGSLKKFLLNILRNSWGTPEEFLEKLERNYWRSHVEKLRELSLELRRSSRRNPEEISEGYLKKWKKIIEELRSNSCRQPQGDYLWNSERIPGETMEEIRKSSWWSSKGTTEDLLDQIQRNF